MQVGFQPQRIAARQTHDDAFDLVQKQFQDQLELVIADLPAQFVDAAPIQHGQPFEESHPAHSRDFVYNVLIAKIVRINGTFMGRGLDPCA